MNRIVLSGRLTKNPELKQTQTGKSITTISIAVDRGQKDNQGNYISDFFNCQAWNKTAEFITRYFVQGDPIELEGQMHNNNYTDKNGVKHYAMVVNVDKVNFAMTKSNNNNNQAGNQNAQQAPQDYQNGYNNSQPNYQGNRGQPPQQAPQGYQNNQNGYGDLTAEYEQFMNDTAPRF